MKKFFYLLPALALVFSACSDDDDDNNSGLGNDLTLTLKASQINGLPSSVAIDEVRLVTYNGGTRTIAKADWNDGFELKFPETVPDSYLNNVRDAFDMYEEEYTKLEISERNAKVAKVYVEAYRNDSYVEDFYFGRNTGKDSEITAMYYYSDRHVKITGTYTDDQYSDPEVYTYNVKLDKGWNRVAMKDSYNGNTYRMEITTSIPSGLAWHYGEF